MAKIWTPLNFSRWVLAILVIFGSTQGTNTRYM